MLSPHRRDWVPALLDTVAGERDMSPFSMKGNADVLPGYEYRGLGCSGNQGTRQSKTEFASPGE
jgi:hypothetical protein